MHHDSASGASDHTVCQWELVSPLPRGNRRVGNTEAADTITEEACQPGREPRSPGSMIFLTSGRLDVRLAHHGSDRC